MNLTLNIKDVTGYPTPAAITATGVTIVINGSVAVDVASAVVAVTNNTIVEVSVSKNGYHKYTADFQVFDYDMSIDIILVPIITDSGDANYRKPYPYFHAYVKPCTHSLYILTTASFPYGEFEYSLDNSVETSVKNPVINIGEAGTFAVKQRVQVTSDPNDVNSSILWDLSISSNKTLTEYRPTLSLQITSSAAPLDGSSHIAVVGEPVTVTPVFEMNNNLGVSCTEGSISYKLYDHAGDQVGTTTTYTINLAVLPTAESIAFTFTPLLKGDYDLVVELTNCCSTTTVEKVISSSAYLVLVSSGHTHKVKNLSTDKTVSVSLYDKDGTTALQTTTFPQTISPGGFYDILVEEDGIYIVKITYGIDLYVFIVHDYNDLRECLTTITGGIICSSEDDCGCGCKDNNKFILNKMIALGASYFADLQAIYGFNNVFTALTDTQIQELYHTSKIFGMMKKYCNCNVKDNFDGGCSSC